MSEITIRQRIDSFKKQIKVLEDAMMKEQNLCSHPMEAVTKKHGVSAGNYLEPDYYWTDFECTICDARWTEEGSK